MTSLFDSKLIVVSGKGGTGKSTIACSLGLLGARRGLRTIVAELGDQQRLAAIFKRPPTRLGVEFELEQDLWSTSIDPDEALVDWLRTIGGGISTRLLTASNAFHYFAAAAPGAKELVSMLKVRELGSREDGCYDLVILDAPATGHALAMLRSPQTFATIVRAGPLATQAQEVRALLEDPLKSTFVAVTHGSELSVSETLELEQGLRLHLNRDLTAIVLNGALKRRFTRTELAKIEDAGANYADTMGNYTQMGANEHTTLANSAVRTARAVYERTRIQQAQIARLRRKGNAEGSSARLMTIPFIFTDELDLTAAAEIAQELERQL